MIMKVSPSSFKSEIIYIPIEDVGFPEHAFKRKAFQKYSRAERGREIEKRVLIFILNKNIVRKEYVLSISGYVLYFPIFFRNYFVIMRENNIFSY